MHICNIYIFSFNVKADGISCVAAHLIPYLSLYTYIFLLIFCFISLIFIHIVDHTRVILRDVDSSTPGAEYINANYIRLLESDQNADLTSMASLENLNSSYATITNNYGNGKCVNCQLLNKVCVQCAIDGSASNKHKRTESLSSIRTNFSSLSTATSTNAKKGGDEFFSKTYIATQGCLPNTIVDFWNMIWQENTRVIVMTTKEIERTKKKCEKYWPEKPGQQSEWGHAKVTCLTETSTNDYTLRELLFSWRGREDRKVYQYHFLVWPDHGGNYSYFLSPQCAAVIESSCGKKRNITFFSLH